MSSCHIDFQHGDGKTLFSQHTNVHNSCCGNYAFMAEKKTLPLSFNILLCYDWKKSFYMVKAQQSIFSTTVCRFDTESIR